MARHTPEPSMDAPDYMVDAEYNRDQHHTPGNKLFDVTQVVGSVYAGGSSDPLVAAMVIIGEALTDLGVAPKGTFAFPTEDGLTVTVTINTTERD